ncbi:hypothetical protein D8B26_002820 [Coccidioides posadasii str. Silveira]|uniref:Uncharacterized protein n=1 Tax=Coccidioides posadasii (strain RMSCC 757 / Silveira) TaxID=443226 RepID=E9CY58_COCPS|nr:conserved hypothetical protein [Coccidioides posadasii str. Silveira]QVM08124.1 hypothetical protein D8B26_002820 [Coccidioides posadasii str. Silveira]
MESTAGKSHPGSKRRRFQIPITSYFSVSHSDPSTQSESLSHYNYAAPTSSANPALPDKVQSSLLTVGMRVRKAVPEGYQTALKTSRLNVYMTNPVSYNTNSYAELAPYCGGFKIGNLAVQTFPPPAIREDHEIAFGRIDQESVPSSSQESTDSVMPSNPHKRAFGEDDAEDEDQEEDITSLYNPKASNPNTAAYSTSRLPLRTILRPRSGRKTQRFVASSRATMGSLQNKLDQMWGLSGQENRHPMLNIPLSADFEEATFLRRREEVDEDYEMGGV